MTGLATSGCMFTRVPPYGFTLDPESQDEFPIPQGSVIYHWANGITEVYGPDNERILIAKDSLEVTSVLGPLNSPFEIQATRKYQIPFEGAYDKYDKDTKTDRYYLGDDVILTIVEKDENYPLISWGIFYVPLPSAP